MVRTVARLALVTTLSTAVLTAPVVVASATPGLGTWTKITTPASTLTYHYALGGTNHLHVAGVTSLDVTQVDIQCVAFILGVEREISHVALAVPVTAGSFTVNTTLSSGSTTNCRLRAVPDGIDVTKDYLGAFTGPIMYTDAFGLAKDGDGKAYSYQAQSEEGDGAQVQTDAASCGTEAIVTVEAPQMEAGPVEITCLFSLGNSLLPGTPTRAAIRVSGHNAYLPWDVHDFIGAPQHLTVTQTSLTVSRSIAHNGDVTITESAPLVRCSVSDDYPPTTVSCPHMVSTGVSFQRVTKFWRNGHQAKIRDTFTSTDHAAHTLNLRYLGVAVNGTSGAEPGTAAGNPGYSYPAHSGTFHGSSLGQTVTGFGTKAGSILIRSDVHARADDPQADTTAATWSRPPSAVNFSSSPTAHDQYSMAYSLNVPAGGKGFLGFATSERWLTTDVKHLASMAVAEMVNPPSIASPHQGATIQGHSTTVKGALSAGGNGLPTKVSVNGHAAHITKTSATAATYKVTFTESLGKHTITVTATDAVGNSAKSSTSVKNV